MSYNEKTQQYDEYPRSQFPGKVDDWANKQDVPVAIRPILAQYQTAWDNMDVNTMDTLKSKYPSILTYIFGAVDINQLQDGVKATQQFFKDDVKTYLTKIGQYQVGLNDTPNEEEKANTAYSSKKTDELTGITVGEDISIPSVDWKPIERTDGFKYQWTYTNEKVKNTDRVMTWFDNPSIIPASKATVAIDDNSTDGTISFISVKIPKKDLTIKLIKIYREQ